MPADDASASGTPAPSGTRPISVPGANTGVDAAVVQLPGAPLAWSSANAVAVATSTEGHAVATSRCANSAVVPGVVVDPSTCDVIAFAGPLTSTSQIAP